MGETAVMNGPISRFSTLAAGRRIRWRALAPRDMDETHRASTPLELLFDLTFVVAVAQVGGELRRSLIDGQAASGMLGYLTVFFAIWWAWMNFTWFASAYDCDDVPYRLLTLVQMAGVLVLAAGVPPAFERQDFLAITIGYVIMRVALVVQWLRAAAGDEARRGVALRYAAGVSAVQVGWLLRLTLPSQAGRLVFFLLVALELLVPVWAERSGPMTSWHPGHIAERYGLFTIIVLGESIFSAYSAVQAAISSRGVSGSLLLLAAGGLITVFALWWTYFERSSDDGLRRAREAAFGWGYGHYAVFASGAALGAGLQVAAVVSADGGHPGNLGAAYAVAVPVACYLLVRGLLHTRLDPARPLLVASLIKAGAVLAAAATAAVLPLEASVLLIGLALAGSVAATLIGLMPGTGPPAVVEA